MKGVCFLSSAQKRIALEHAAQLMREKATADDSQPSTQAAEK